MSKINRILKLTNIYKKAALTKEQNNIIRLKSEIFYILNNNQERIKEISEKFNIDYENIKDNIENLSYDVILQELTFDKVEQSLKNIKNIENFLVYLNFYLSNASHEINRIEKTLWPELKTILVNNSDLLHNKE